MESWRRNIGGRHKSRGPRRTVKDVWGDRSDREDKDISVQAVDPDPLVSHEINLLDCDKHWKRMKQEISEFLVKDI